MTGGQRVCLVTPILPTSAGGWGGIHTHAGMLIELLLRSGRKVTVLAPWQPGVEVPAGCDVFFIKGKYTDFPAPEWFSALKEAFRASLMAGRPDVIISEGYYALGLETEAAGIPVTAFVHNFHLIHFYKLFTEIDGPRALASFTLRTLPMIVRNLLFYELPFLRRAAKVACVSGLNAGLLKKFYRLASSSLLVLHNWVETDYFRPAPEAREKSRSALGLAAAGPVFLLVGALWRPKGFQVAIEAFSRVSRQLPGAALLIAGSGPYERDLRRLANERLPDGSVKFLGELRHKELPGLHAAADVFLMPSIHPEGLAYALLEAMSSGLPVIATALGGNIESVGDSGLLVPPRDPDALARAMLRLAGDRGLRERLAGAARARALALFSKEKAARALEDLLT